ncbi:hypothetical protein LM7414_110211 [Listeria monocytogenes]|nr:hypothetical protein LM7414_110211 [Listeria monocytogenes]
MEAHSKTKGQAYSQNSFIFIVFDYLINYSDKNHTLVAFFYPILLN